ncbi:rhodanese-like domain-containing protein [Nonlabens ponticola]|uniref:Rhodanese-like domain-containing protein n=1 Tax=Nonlabens ponticola TaxID=2496866 RepID=A0A3S9N103_9FLAO|nr:rhodanese-like domain-containing protein [Nonlabens ponticola]AZQ45069.1 rhodanese-like domain-containing protein [Nonlabens ponticola]
MWGFFNKNKSSKIKDYVEQDATLLDVRTASEYNSDHIEGSINIPVQGIDAQMDKLDKNKPIVVYCAMGGRSGIAASKLKRNGFKVVNAQSIRNMRKNLK